MKKGDISKEIFLKKKSMKTTKNAKKSRSKIMKNYQSWEAALTRAHTCGRQSRRRTRASALSTANPIKYERELD